MRFWERFQNKWECIARAFIEFSKTWPQNKVHFAYGRFQTAQMSFPTKLISLKTNFCLENRIIFLIVGKARNSCRQNAVAGFLVKVSYWNVILVRNWKLDLKSKHKEDLTYIHCRFWNLSMDRLFLPKSTFGFLVKSFKK